MALSDYALQAADIFVPGETVNPTKWAVISCDQYTSQPEYWQAVTDFVGDVPSTLQLIYPEVYLGQEDGRLDTVPAAMEQALKEHWVTPLQGAMVYLRRRTPYHALRQGLVAAVDLEAFTYTPGGNGLIRSTEGVVMERIPPRLAIRKKAALEVPHIMLLVDDPENVLFSALASRTEKRQPVYDFDLMMAAGHATGYALTGEDLAVVENAMAAILQRAAENDAAHPMLMAVGDGNHSLVTAKAHWEELKAAGASADHPARYALAEIVNLHDTGLGFEPIHRVVFTEQPKALLEGLLQLLPEGKPTERELHCLTAEGDIRIPLSENASPLQEALLQEVLGRLEERFSFKVDYIHGEQAVQTLVAKGNALGFFMPPFDPAGLFPYVVKKGALPKKSFSMGHADEKRFYIECRSIR